MSRSLDRPARTCLAVAAEVDTRTVDAYLEGTKTLRRASRAAIERGLRKMGRGDLVRPAAPAEGREP